VLPENASYQGTLRACEQSLARLGTDRLDLYMIHWPGRHPLGETFRAFETLRSQGKILRWGVSNFDVGDLESAVAAAGQARHPAALCCNQVLYHLGDRAIEHELLAACEQHDVPVVAYSPFGAGNFKERAHVDDNAGAQGLALSADDIAEIDAAHPKPKRRTLGFI
jgi:diketogulonate reductase-like aldo/keto reductase